MLDLKPTLQISINGKSKSLKSNFVCLFGRYKIIAVHKFEKCDEDPSGYKHISQNSRPDQWGKLIQIKSKFLNSYHKIQPIEESDILTVIISRGSKEPYDYIDFNK